jgi:hypothetical protein
MANVIILDPARFNSDLVGGTRRYIRTAFFDQGYGVSERFSGYARGAGIVPDTAPFSTIGLGTSGSPLRMSQFSGLVVPSPVVISIANDNVAADAVYESDFDFNTATYGIRSDGTIDATHTSTNGGGSDGTTNGTNWVTPTSSASLYEVRATKVSGDTPNAGSALNTWLACTTNRSWALYLTGVGVFACTLTIEIRDAATQTVQDTATITMMAKNQN